MQETGPIYIPIEIEIIEKFRDVYVSNLDSPEQEGYLANKNYIWNFSCTLSVLAGGPFLRKFVAKSIKKWTRIVQKDEFFQIAHNVRTECTPKQNKTA